MSDFKLKKSETNINKVNLNSKINIIDSIFGDYNDYKEDKEEKKQNEKEEQRNNTINMLNKYGVPEEYYEELCNLVDSIYDNPTKYKEILKKWIKNTKIPLGDLFNKLFNGQTDLKFAFTDEFIKKYSDNIVHELLDVSLGKALNGEISLNIIRVFEKLASKDNKTQFKAIMSLVHTINNLGISYKELESQIPNLSEYIIKNIEIEGANITEENIESLWDSITYYKKFNNIEKAHLAALFGNPNLEIGLQEYEQITTTTDIYKALKNILPNLGTDELSKYFSEDTIKYIIKKIIKNAYDEPEFIDDLFDIIEVIKNDTFFSKIDKISEFSKKYNIDLLKIGADYVTTGIKSFMGSFFEDYSGNTGADTGHSHSGAHIGSGRHR